MCRPEEIAVVIPCLNEAPAIGPLVSEIRAFITNVIVVNDGSTDDTAKLSAAAGAFVLNHSSPLGKGASLRAGFKAATELGFTRVLAMDGDGQHAPADIPAFLRKAETSSAAMLIGNRMADCKSMPLLRRWVNRCMSATISTFSNCSIPDSQCGFRLVNLNAWNRIQFHADHFEIESEMILRIIHAGHEIDSVPIQTRYASENSKIRPFRDTFRWFRWWFAVRHELTATSFSSAQPRFDSQPQDATA